MCSFCAFPFESLLQLGQGVFHIVAHDGLPLLGLLALHFLDELLFLALQLLHALLVRVCLRLGRRRGALVGLFGGLWAAEDLLVELQSPAGGFVVLRGVLLEGCLRVLLEFVVVLDDPLLAEGGDLLI